MPDSTLLSTRRKPQALPVETSQKARLQLAKTSEHVTPPMARTARALRLTAQARVIWRDGSTQTGQDQLRLGLELPLMKNSVREKESEQ